MSLTLEEIKEKHDKSYLYGQINRQAASDDMVFKFITQWDDNMIEDFLGTYRGEFDILTKAIRKIISDLMLNPVQAEFEPINEPAEKSADLIEGIYITDDGRNSSIEAYENAEQECVVCGVGAWELSTEYVSIASDDNRQRVIRTPIYEANNNVFWDPNGKMKDKSDATYCTVLESYTPDAYKILHEELTGEEPTTMSPPSFANPETSYVFPWASGEGEKIWIGKFFHEEIKKVKVLTFTDPFGTEVQMRESDLKDVMDEMSDQGYDITGEKKTEIRTVTQYIVSGQKILDEAELSCGYIPIVPMYGEYAIVEGELHYEGAVRRAKDPARLRNFALSYLASIVQSAPKEKNIYWKEQIAGLERYFEQGGADDNLPYAVMHRTAADGSTMPPAPIGTIPAASIPPALTELTAQAKEAVTDVADPGVPQNLADADISGKAVIALQAELDKQSMIYQQHRKHAKRRDAQIYASFHARIMDIPQTVITTAPDGTRTKTEVMNIITDEETGNDVVLNDLRNAEFEVFTKIGPSYSSKKEKSLDMLQSMVASIDPGDPLRKALQLKQLALMDSFDFKDIREHANKQLVLLGFKQAETDEEKQALQQAQQQPQEPSAEMVLAQGKLLEGQAAKEKNQIEVMKVQQKAKDDETTQIINEFKAATERMNAQVDAQEAGATINYKRVDTMGKELDNAEKMQELQMPQLSVADMSDDELFAQVAG